MAPGSGEKANMAAVVVSCTSCAIMAILLNVLYTHLTCFLAALIVLGGVRCTMIDFASYRLTVVHHYLLLLCFFASMSPAPTERRERLGSTVAFAASCLILPYLCR